MMIMTMVMKKNNGVFLFLVLVSVFSCVSAAFVSRHSFSPLNFILGNQNLGPLKNGILGQAEAPGPATSEPKIPLILAGNRTRRPDILRKFKIYDGGWNISNRHYWASVGFTGAAGFIISVLWLISFGIALLVHHCFGWKINFEGKKSLISQMLRPTLVILFSCAAVAGCILLSIGQHELHSEVLHTLNYVVNQSDFTAQMLRNVTQYLSLAESVDVPQFKLPPTAMEDIDNLRVRLSSGADTLTEKTTENSSKVRKVFNPVISALIAVASLMLLLIFVGLVLSLLKCQNAIYIFIFSGWILVAASLILCGTFVIFNSAISDSCVAMQEWVENPQAETALSNILPCVDERATNQTLYESKRIVNFLVNTVNAFVYTAANTQRPPSDQFYYNQSGPLMPPLCYPFGNNMQDRECSPQEASFTNASLVWEKYICMTSVDQKNCTTVGRLTPGMYSQLVLAANASYALLHYTPAMLDLQNCNFLRETFMTITSQFCPPLEHYLRIVELGLGLISTGIMLCLILCLVYSNRPQREEVFVKFRSIGGNDETRENGQGNKEAHINMVSLVTSPARVAPDIEK
ncbi:uncharacterized protein LOC141643919 [Silene latifolia]|uniref:uncharacterized protein LOC141643919 n=1 Tax=Silene latifolia TaxID=37657 RepID=UPI003D78A063